MKTLQCLIYLSLVGSLFQSASGQEIARIEEDWELHVMQPNEQLDAPQITMMMFPLGDQADLILQFDLNYASWPQFDRGGILLLASESGQTISAARDLNGQLLAHDFETVKWTQAVQKNGNGLHFGIVSGTSDSWGAFGGASSFINVPLTNAGSSGLENYRPQASLENSGVTYASNRVASLVLKRIRLVLADGNVSEWTLNASAE